MPKNDKFYTFLLSHTTKTKIYIRRVEVPKSLLHTGVASSILILGLITISFTSIFKNISFAKSVNNNSTSTALLANPVSAAKPLTEKKSIDYSHPVKNERLSINTGGPVSTIDIDSDVEIEEGELEDEMQKIETTSNPAFLPTIWAHSGKINNEYGFRRNPFGGRSYEFHGGLDIDGERGDNVLAPANGVVTRAGWQGGYGNLIEIDHGNGLTTRYGHLSQGVVQVGDAVQRGQLIGMVGSTGRSTGPHLHYELRVNDKPVNPRRLLPPEPFALKKAE